MLSSGTYGLDSYFWFEFCYFLTLILVLYLPLADKVQKQIDKCSFVRNLFHRFRIFESVTYFCSAIADVAQLVEHILGRDEVVGSNPIVSSKRYFIIEVSLFLFCISVETKKLP